MFRDRKVLGWALYDWANSAFATTVLAGFFPILFKEYWNAGVDAATSTARLGDASSLASLVVAILAPLLGAIADRAGRRKAGLFAFTMLGLVMTGALGMVEKGHWQLASLCFILAQIGFSGGLGFYDSLLVGVARPADYDRVSGLGYALGYLGGGILFALNVAMVLLPVTFGFEDGAEAARFSFFTVALWWAVFALPLFFWVPEQVSEPRVGVGQAVREGLAELRRTLRHIAAARHIALFLLAYWFYIDGVDTVIRMAVDYGLSLGFKSGDLITALLIVQFVGFPAALLFGWLGQRIGPKPGIYIALAVYSGVTLWATQMETVKQFYLLAVFIALVQGGVQALSRSYYARLIPADKAGEFYGFYNMLGKFAAVIGPWLMGMVTLATGDVRIGLLSILLLFGIGGGLLFFVRAPGAES
ncbi:MAG TPA: MFS transporter [Rhodocyclaceae bacterium]|nr:MFS transporter [Rhodocyclaceae bacterium]